jgi:transposase-like protein
MEGSIMGQPTTTHAVRAAIQRSQASLAQLSKELGINPKTVAKWRKRTTVEDLKTGPREPRSTVLTEAEESMIVAFRRVIRYCRWMIASMRFSRRFRT